MTRSFSEEEVNKWKKRNISRSTNLLPRKNTHQKCVKNLKLVEMPKNILNTQTKFAVCWFVFVGSAGCWLGLLVIGFVCCVSQFVGCVVFQRFVGEEGWSGWRRHPQWAFVQPTRPTTCEQQSCTQCQHVTQNNKSNGDAVETTTKFFQRPHVVMSKIFPVICVSLSLYLQVVLHKFRLNI